MTYDELVAVRRDLHQHAEPAFLEIRTSTIVVTRLRALGIEPRTGRDAMRTGVVTDYPSVDQLDRFASRAVAAGADAALAEFAAAHGTAVVCEIEGDLPGPTWALRFDMDGLPLTESDEPAHVPAAAGFRCADGFMHACGHDGHTAIGLALAERLVADRGFAGRVRLLFQPAEEGGRGAASMLAAGAADGVDKFVALHLGLDLPTGVVAGGVEGMLATTKLRATYTGAAAHAALSPQEGRNALLGAASAALAVMALPRYSTADTRINVGTLRAGDNVNIVPSWAEMTLEARSTDSAVCEDLTERIETRLHGAAAMHDLRLELHRTGGSTTMRCDRPLVDAVGRAAATLLGDSAAHSLWRMNGSDDASLFAHAVQQNGGMATYTVVGADHRAPHHHPSFDIDESAMAVALEVLDELIRTPHPRDSPSPHRLGFRPRGSRAHLSTEPS
ncbi:amidohydrolase [Lentzea sp. E54]|uniref:amidohydrolase n=1 Tax=Lentzea xerophila TaxID=3435883 RepID=UPI003DA559B6